MNLVACIGNALAKAVRARTTQDAPIPRYVLVNPDTAARLGRDRVHGLVVCTHPDLSGTEFALLVKPPAPDIELTRTGSAGARPLSVGRAVGG